MVDVLLGVSAVVLAAFVSWRLIFRALAAKWVPNSRRPNWAGASAAAQTLTLSLGVGAALTGKGSIIFWPIVVLGLIMVVVSTVLTIGAGIRRIPVDEEEPRR